MSSFFSELRRRNVVKVGVAYAVVGWILVEVASVVMPGFGAPDWVFKVIMFVVFLGFPLALLFAWAFELTPEGLKRTHEVPVEHSVTHQTGRKLDFGIIGLLAVALSISIFLHFVDDAPSDDDYVNGRLSIAVLPFTSRSNDPDNVLFADGIHDDLLTTLAKIGSMKVISRTSVMEYRDTTKNLKEIGDELGVANVMEGAVQKYGNNVRINVQLIDADTDEHLWAESYDRELTTKNLFAIQSEISQEIATALKTTLTPEEQTRIAAVPTENLEAYNYYLAGRNLMAQRNPQAMQLARQQFEKTIATDPNFADAYSGLADSLMLLENNYSLLEWDEVKVLVPQYLETALTLDNQSAQVHASRGLYKMTVYERDYTEPALLDAVKAYERAIELNPNYAQAYFWFAIARSDQELYDEAIKLQEKALELDPLARIPMLNLGSSYADQGRLQDAIDQFLRAADLHADYEAPRSFLGQHLMAMGRLDEGLAWMLESRKLDPISSAYWVSAAYLALGDKENARAVFDSYPTDQPFYVDTQAIVAQIDGDNQKAFELLKGSIESLDHAPWYRLNNAATYAVTIGDVETARDYLLAVDPRLGNREDPRVEWGVPVNTTILAYAAQRTGEPEYADRIIDRSLEVAKKRPRMGINGFGVWDAHLYTLKGDKEMALAKLREAVDAGWRSYPFINAWHLADNPMFELLWEEPEFQTIVAEVNADLARQRKNVEEAEATGNWQALLDRARQVSVADASE